MAGKLGDEETTPVVISGTAYLNVSLIAYSVEHGLSDSKGITKKFAISIIRNLKYAYLKRIWKLRKSLKAPQSRDKR